MALATAGCGLLGGTPGVAAGSAAEMPAVLTEVEEGRWVGPGSERAGVAVIVIVLADAAVGAAAVSEIAIVAATVAPAVAPVVGAAEVVGAAVVGAATAPFVPPVDEAGIVVECVASTADAVHHAVVAKAAMAPGLAAWSEPEPVVWEEMP